MDSEIFINEKFYGRDAYRYSYHSDSPEASIRDGFFWAVRARWVMTEAEFAETVLDTPLENCPMFDVGDTTRLRTGYLSHERMFTFGYNSAFAVYVLSLEEPPEIKKKLDEEFAQKLKEEKASRKESRTTALIIFSAIALVVLLNLIISDPPRMFVEIYCASVYVFTMFVTGHIYYTDKYFNVWDSIKPSLFIGGIAFVVNLFMLSKFQGSLRSVGLDFLCFTTALIPISRGIYEELVSRRKKKQWEKEHKQYRK